MAYTLQIKDFNDPDEIQEYYLNIMSNMPNNVYWLDKNCITRGCNKNVLKFMGLKKLEDFVGITYEKMGELANWTEEQIQSSKRDHMEVVSTGKSKINIEEPPFYDEDGNVVYYLSTKVPLFNKNKSVIGIVGISVDITHIKKIEAQLKLAKEQAEAANKAKSEFIANISHDIRTPITGLLGMSKILSEDVMSEKGKQAVNNLVKSANILLGLLNDVIEFTKLESGELPVYDIKFSMKALIDDICALIIPSIQQKGLKLVVHYDTKIPPSLIGDKNRINRILINLLGNAIKFTQKGEIEISVVLAKRKAKNIVLKIEVKDTGVGIPLDKQKIIFSKFEKLNPSYTGLYKGYGLGLSIVKQFISEINGEIYVNSEENKGSVFTCVIPLKAALLDEMENQIKELEQKFSTIFELAAEDTLQSTQNENTLEKQNQVTRPEDEVSYHVLLVEDNKIAQMSGKHLLELTHCHVEVADTGEQVLPLLEKNEYDMIFMDVGLPGKNGIEVAAEIRASEKKKKHYTPIIALTAHIDKTTEKLCLDAGMNEVLTKPLNEQKTQKILKKYYKAL